MGHDPQLREMESARLDSWKEIASFLHRDARTVRRWEQERRLPVHRVPGGERSGVFAYVSELERWLHASGPAVEYGDGEAPPVGTGTTAPSASAAPNQHASNGHHTNSHHKGQTLASAKEAYSQAEDEKTPTLSAFHSLNSFETTFAPKLEAVDSRAVPLMHRAVGDTWLLSRRRQYQTVSLLVLLSVAIGISAGVVRYREAKAVKAAGHRPNAEAQDLYLRGRYYWNERTESGLNSAVDLFTQSIVHDPNYAEAYAGLADCYLLLRQYGHMPDAEAYPRALAAARQAIALNDTSPEAHRSIAFVLRFWNWDMAAAEKEYRRAIELNPSDSQSHHWYATALLASNRYREALTQIDIARRLEPQSVSVLADRGLILSMLDLHAGAIALEQVEQAQPNFLSTHIYLSNVYLHSGDYEKFVAEGQLAGELSHNATTVAILESARKTLASRGPDPMLREIATGFAPLADRGAVSAFTTARFFGLAGEPMQAMRYLHIACDRREPGFLNVEDDPAFAQLRSSSEYVALINRRDVSMGTSKQPIARLDAPDLSE